MKDLSNFKLCYVTGNAAYFTTKDLAEQWGYDWDDAPYEHNAGAPYYPSRPDLPNRHELYPDDWNEDLTPKWEILKVYWDGYFDLPESPYSNSPFSVEQINAGVIAWLRPGDWSKNKKAIIAAGTTFDKFVELIESNEGNVYIPNKLLR